MEFNMAKCDSYVPIRLWVPLARVKSIVYAKNG